jgi:hypothetical protein
MLRIQLDNSQTNLRPGEKFRGTIFWDLETVPAELNAYLVWHTEGKGDEDFDNAIEESWNPSVNQGSQRFEWIAPRGPLSLNGKLLRICWELEASVPEIKESAKLEVVISPVDRPIILRGYA